MFHPVSLQPLSILILLVISSNHCEIKLELKYEQSFVLVRKDASEKCESNTERQMCVINTACPGSSPESTAKVLNLSSQHRNRPVVNSMKKYRIPQQNECFLTILIGPAFIVVTYVSMFIPTNL